MFKRYGLSPHLFAAAMMIVLGSTVFAQTPPPLLLAETYQQGMSLEGYWISEKLDGVRAFWDGEQLQSRQGHVFNAPAWFIAGFPDQPLDGELWMGRQRFSELSAAVRRYLPDPQEWRQIRFMVFDLPASHSPFSERVRQLRSLLEPSPSPYLALTAQHPASSHEALMTRLDRVVAGGGEGLMLHHGDSLYRAGRSDDLLKVKRHQDAEAVVIGHVPGEGRHEGRLGALLVERQDGRRFRIGTGFSDAERETPPALGIIVTYKYFGLTSTGLPRFASFLRVRDDEPNTP
ncbi:DNA ligase [Marinobacter sp. SS21]|uniref:DNA ligase n=1 Tax=Marinobacter sp. SS21 TaxID=2979460 RepID=UPI00232EDCDB|nr:DNA ligase [Marinobacter sp. SS21]MDC0662916.1 DNA ligase [Marinobacter sp. SS21]